MITLTRRPIMNISGNEFYILPACISNENTLLVYFKVLSSVIEQQLRIGNLYNVGANMEIVEKITDNLSVSDLNDLIDKININFELLNNVIIENNTIISNQYYSENQSIKAFFQDSLKEIDIVVSDNNITIEGEHSVVRYNVDSEEVDYDN